MIHIKASKKERVFFCLNHVLMVLLCFITLYPIWNILVLSFNDGLDALKGNLYWWPRVFSLENYRVIFKDDRIMNSFFISFLRTSIGTVATILFTAMTAYIWGKNYLIGRKLYMVLGTVTLFFTGGLIPTFLLIVNLGLYNNFLVLIIPSLFNFFNLLIFQAFFRDIPPSLEESATIDGANEFTIFLRIILPLSKPVLATIALFHGVWVWNDFFTGMIYIKSDVLQPIATLLYSIVKGVEGANLANSSMSSSVAGVISSMQSKAITSQSVQLATMVVATLPIIVIYPFLQKYFIKGLLIGSVKE